MGRVVSQRELGEIMGITPKSLSLWQRDGMPCLLETEAGLAPTDTGPDDGELDPQGGDRRLPGQVLGELRHQVRVRR